MPTFHVLRLGDDIVAGGMEIRRGLRVQGLSESYDWPGLGPWSAPKEVPFTQLKEMAADGSESGSEIGWFRQDGGIGLRRVAVDLISVSWRPYESRPGMTEVLCFFELPGDCVLEITVNREVIEAVQIAPFKEVDHAASRCHPQG